MRIANRLQVGIDVSKNRLDIALLAPDGEPIETHRAFANNLEGYGKAKELLREVLEKHEFDGVDIAAEATSYYWLPSFIHFAQDDELSSYQPRLYLLNARWVRWYKKSLSPDHKDDMTDPQYIADRIRTRKPNNTWEYEPKWLKLRFLTRLRAHLTKSLGREKNLFQLYLFLAYNAYSQKCPFRKSLAKTSQELLHRPELLAQLEQMPSEEIADQLFELSGHHLPAPLKYAAPLKQALHLSFPIPDELADTLQFLLDQLMFTIDHLQADLKNVEDQIEKLIEQGDYPDVALLRSIPGIGTVLASGLVAEIGGLERFLCVHKWDKKLNCFRQRWIKEVDDAIGKIAGLWWPKNDSGRFEAEDRHMSKEGNAYLRYYILEAAERMRLLIPSFSSYYQSKYDQAVIHKHKRALVLTGRKALSLFVSLLYHKETFRAKEAASKLR